MTVAEQVFLHHGFGDTTMQMVAAEAGASKETLYRHFRNKEALFAEVVGNHARKMRVRLDADFSRPNAIEDVLRDLGTKLLECMTSPDVVALLKLVVSEAQRDPEIGRIFYANGPERNRTRLMEFLAAAHARGEFVGDNPGLAATIFLGGIAGHVYLARLATEPMPPMRPEDIAERVEEVVAMFMLRYARPAAG